MMLKLCCFLLMALLSVCGMGVEPGTIIPAAEIAAGRKLDDGTVTNHGDWQPVVFLKPPATGDEWTLFVKYKGAPILAKSVSGQKQTDLDWSWKKPADFEWVRVGRYQKSRIGDGLIIIGGSGDRPVIAAVALLADPTQTPENPAVPAAAPAAAPSERTEVRPDTVIPAGAFAVGEKKPSPLAFGGSFVTQTQAWNPVVRMPLPATGDEFTVYVRYRGGVVCLKAVNDDKQKEIGWMWENPSAFTWRKAGRLKRSEMKDGILIIRGDNGQGAPEVDAVMFVSDPNLVPEKTPGYQEPQLPPVTISADWAKPAGPVGGRLYGLNLFQGIDPEVVANPAYRLNLGYMAPGLVRIHSMNMMNPNHPGCWLDLANKTWDSAKITRLFSGLRPGNADVIVNICHFPKWLKRDAHGRLDPAEYDRFAEFCADLVRLVNVKLHAKVKYWEITNELDDAYWVKPSERGEAIQPGELAKLYLLAARAMKKVDPSIKTGGPATARADKLAEQKAFAAAALPELDFFSFHMYASGSAKDSDEAILVGRAKTFAEYNQHIRNFLDEISPARRIEAFLDEYNISWTWEVRDKRMTDHVGAVFDALVIAGAAEAGIDGVTAWNECDGIYGKMDNSYALRPSASLYHLLNRYAVGNRVHVTGSSADIVPYAVLSGGKRTLMLINRSGNPQRVKLTEALSDNGRLFRISKDGFQVLSKQSEGTSIQLPRMSVTMLTEIGD